MKTQALAAVAALSATLTAASLTSVAALLMPASAHAQTAGMESDWIEFVKGHREARMGAEVRDVSEDPETGTTTLIVAIPKESMGEPHTEMEEVTVIGKAPEKTEFKPLFPDIQTQWVDDYDNDFYGLLVRLNGDQKVPFRLFFSAHGQGGAIENHPQQP